MTSSFPCSEALTSSYFVLFVAISFSLVVGVGHAGRVTYPLRSLLHAFIRDSPAFQGRSSAVVFWIIVLRKILILVRSAGPAISSSSTPVIDLCSQHARAPPLLNHRQFLLPLSRYPTCCGVLPPTSLEPSRSRKETSMPDRLPSRSHEKVRLPLPSGRDLAYLRRLGTTAAAEPCFAAGCSVLGQVERRSESIWEPDDCHEDSQPTLLEHKSHSRMRLRIVLQIHWLETGHDVGLHGQIGFRISVWSVVFVPDLGEFSSPGRSGNSR